MPKGKRKIREVPIRKAKRSTKKALDESDFREFKSKKIKEIEYPTEEVVTPQLGSILAELDCGLFNDELSAGLKNKSKLKIKINNNVVTKIN